MYSKERGWGRQDPPAANAETPIGPPTSEGPSIPNWFKDLKQVEVEGGQAKLMLAKPPQPPTSGTWKALGPAKEKPTEESTTVKRKQRPKARAEVCNLEVTFVEMRENAHRFTANLEICKLKCSCEGDVEAGNSL